MSYDHASRNDSDAGTSNPWTRRTAADPGKATATRLLDGRTEADHLAYLTLMRGLAFERENLQWAQRALPVLDQRTTVPTE